MVRVVAMALMAFVALWCVCDLRQPAMAAMAEQDCFAPVCKDQIACGQVGEPRISSGPVGHVVVLPATVDTNPLIAKAEAQVVVPSPTRIAWQSVVRLGPRSPPAS